MKFFVINDVANRMKNDVAGFPCDTYASDCKPNCPQNHLSPKPKPKPFMDKG